MFDRHIGKWMQCGIGGGVRGFVCTNCGTIHSSKLEDCTRRCPYCGSFMLYAYNVFTNEKWRIKTSCGFIKLGAAILENIQLLIYRIKIRMGSIGHQKMRI